MLTCSDRYVSLSINYTFLSSQIVENILVLMIPTSLISLRNLYRGETDRVGSFLHETILWFEILQWEFSLSVISKGGSSP